MNRVRSFLLATFAALLWWTACASAGVPGTPALDRYGARDTGAHPYSFAVLPLPDGQVFVANLDGVLRYFGGRWSLIQMPKRGIARSLALGRDGRVYVGGYAEFGALQREPGGRYRYQSLSRPHFTDPAVAPGSEIWDVIATETRIYFATSRRLYWVGYEGGAGSQPLSAGLIALFALDGGLVAALDDGRVARVDGDSLTPWFQLPSKLRGVWRAQGGVLALSEQHGMFRVGEQGAERLRTSGDALITGSVPYAAMPLADGGLVIGTLAGKLLRIDEALDISAVWELGSEAITGLGLDSAGGLWATTESAIGRIALDSPWSKLDTPGLRGATTDVLEADDALLVTTSLGVFRASPGQDAMRFQAAGLANVEVNQIETLGGDVLLGTRRGLYRWQQDQIETIDPEPVIWVMRGNRDGDLVVLTETGLRVYRRQAQGWQLRQRIEDPSYRFDHFVEDAAGTLWIGQYLDRPYVLKREGDGYGSAALIEAPALPTGEGVAVLMIDGLVHLLSNTAAYRRMGQAFEPLSLSELLPAGLEASSELRMERCPGGQQYLHSSRRLFLREQAGWRELRPLDDRSSGIVNVVCAASDTALIATWDGLVRYAPSKTKAEAPLPTPQMERVWRVPRQGRAEAQPIAPPRVQVLQPFLRLRFEYAAPALSGRWRYRSRLLGYEQRWTRPLASNAREFSALGAGEYTFEVQAIDVAGQTSAPLQYRFRVVPRWYESWWMPLLVLLALAVAVYLAGRLRSRALALRNRELERLVQERTQALEQRSVELEDANQRLRDLADLDGLTGVANRRKLDQFIDHSVRQARQLGTPLALLLMDVDHFKQFNDRHGHLLGDEALQRIAERLHGWVADGELLARYGGEEFVLVMPDATLERALERAHAICRDARQVRNGGVSLTLSIGVSEWIAHRAGSALQLFEYADIALYRAKQEGRDRVEAYVAPNAITPSIPD